MLPVRIRRPPRGGAPVADEFRYELLPVDGVHQVALELPAGARVTVTCSPRWGVDRTVDVVTDLAGLGLRTIPHLAARQVRDEAHLAHLVERLDCAGVDEVFVVGGDAPEPVGAFASGLELLEAAAASGWRPARIGVPGYPEGHGLIADDLLWEALAAKAVYATEVVTQLCFDERAIAGWIVEARRRGIHLPVFAGVPGAVEAAALLRISQRVGVGDSLRFLRAHRGVARRLLRPGGAHPVRLLEKLDRELSDRGVEIAGAHVYTFNRVGATVALLEGARVPTVPVFDTPTGLPEATPCNPVDPPASGPAGEHFGGPTPPQHRDPRLPPAAA